MGRERNNQQIENFRQALSDTGLFDLGYEEPKYTWKGPREKSDHIQAGLDRGLAITHFLKFFPTALRKTPQ